MASWTPCAAVGREEERGVERRVGWVERGEGERKWVKEKEGGVEERS